MMAAATEKVRLPRFSFVLGIESCSGQSASFSARQNIIMIKTGFFSSSAQNFGVLLVSAWYYKHEMGSSSSVASRMVF